MLGHGDPIKDLLKLDLGFQTPWWMLNMLGLISPLGLYLSIYDKFLLGLCDGWFYVSTWLGSGAPIFSWTLDIAVKLCCRYG